MIYPDAFLITGDGRRIEHDPADPPGAFRVTQGAVVTGLGLADGRVLSTGSMVCMTPGTVTFGWPPEPEPARRYGWYPVRPRRRRAR